jgi:protein-S-isoprenylcysteine O-methyltransferase Ste14
MWIYTAKGRTYLFCEILYVIAIYVFYRKGDHMAEPTSIPMPSRELLRAVSVRLTLGAFVIGTLLFAPAGSLHFWNGWLFMATLFVPMTIFLVYLYRKDRSLLEKRLRLHEKQKEQKVYVKLSLIWFVVSFLVPGFDYRFGWSNVPVWLIVASVVVMIFGYFLFILVMVQNTFASRVIEIQQNQRVIDTGLYLILRHPMYIAAIIMFMAWPLVLGSYYGLVPTMLLPVLLVYRIRNEEVYLRSNLDGYIEYTERVRYRLIPYVW